MDNRLRKLVQDSQSNDFQTFAEAVRFGMSDHELESLARHPRWPGEGFAPWICWESENSSFGLLFRDWTGFPRWLPLPLVTPHGAFSGSRIWPNEVDGRANLFFGWPEKRVEERKNLGFPESYLVQHPWINYRREYFKPNPARRGVVFFYPHTNSFMKPWFPKEHELLAELKIMKEKYESVTLCLSFHDIAEGKHKELRRLGFPLVTAGATSSTRFVGRFYSIISQFEHTASSELGSQVFYCIEAGVPHTLTQTSPDYKLALVEGKPSIDPLNDYSHLGSELEELDLFRESLTLSIPKITSFQRNYVAECLGLGRGIQAKEARRLLYRSLAREKLGIPRLLGKISARFQPKSRWK